MRGKECQRWIKCKSSHQSQGRLRSSIFFLNAQMGFHFYHPQVIHVRNVLSLPIHPAATVAMAEFIAEHPATGFVAQHHDFAYEDDFLTGDRKKGYTIPHPAIQERVEKALLYDAPNVRHAVINSLLQKRLAAEYGTRAAII